jgi:hypothetical protein
MMLLCVCLMACRCQWSEDRGRQFGFLGQQRQSEEAAAEGRRQGGGSSGDSGSAAAMVAWQRLLEASRPLAPIIVPVR